MPINFRSAIQEATDAMDGRLDKKVKVPEKQPVYLVGSEGNEIPTVPKIIDDFMDSDFD